MSTGRQVQGIERPRRTCWRKSRAFAVLGAVLVAAALVRPALAQRSAPPAAPKAAAAQPAPPATAAPPAATAFTPAPKRKFDATGRTATNAPAAAPEIGGE